ncbi:MAG: hypothetical protein NTW64_01195 [Candidatus Omnitrophica bacterium]|nr:hypothetical protein [Candidatus Omnitrophota bacterium]
MDKKESLSKEINFSPKMPGFSNRIFGIIKLIMGLCLLPVVYSTTIAFLKECAILDKEITNYFSFGIIGFLVLYLFIYEPLAIYNKGQKILEVVFRFFTPLVRVAPYVLPIYTIIISVIYLLYALISKSTDSVKYFVLLLGFSIALHLVFSARSLRLRQSDFLKSNYIFGFSFIYIINLVILGFVFSLIFETCSFVNFCNHSYQITRDILNAIFKQLFL